MERVRDRDQQAKSVIVGVRLSPTDVARLDALCARTCRSRANLMRVLLAQAEALPTPDVVIQGGGGQDGR